MDTERKFTFITSWDDGSTHDLKLASILNEYGIPAIFYIPTNCELEHEDILNLHEEGFIIGAHTETHPKDMKLLSNERQYQEIKNNKEWLEDIIQEPVEDFAYPRGRYNGITIESAKRAGIKYCRTTVQGSIDHITDPYRILTSVHVFPSGIDPRKPDWFSDAMYLMLRAMQTNGCFHLWGHSAEIEKYNLWQELEKFFKVLEEYEHLRT